ncbi:MAG: efflux RND transporter periplasmic adaptor subunit [Cyclobacteriaceae bacterium]|nr:efflux RND transporter periplasmic adaptor subunit [Cyclobacteriaceae bacterium]
MLLRSIPNIFSILFIVMVFSCTPKGQQPQKPGPVNVTVQKISEKDAVYYDEYPATVIALNQVELRPQVNGYITAVHFKEGDRVKKGQKLYSIDQQQYEAAYQQSVANQAVQEANLVKAQKDVERYRELNKHDAVAKQLVDNAEANYEAAKRTLEASKASVKSVQTNVRYTSITAPFDGTIGISQVRLGTAVSAGQTILNTVSSDNPIAADLSIDQKEIYRFVQFQGVKSSKTDSTFRLAFNGIIYPHPGKISLIDRAVNAQTGTIIVRLEFSNPENNLRAGMSGTVRVLNDASKKSILVPFKAITEQLGEYFVYVVKTDSNKVTQQRVIIGKQVARDVVILKGLNDGETIVVEGVQNLKEGSAIAVKNGNETAKNPTK